MSRPETVQQARQVRRVKLSFRIAEWHLNTAVRKDRMPRSPLFDRAAMAVIAGRILLNLEELL